MDLSKKPFTQNIEDFDISTCKGVISEAFYSIKLIGNSNVSHAFVSINGEREACIVVDNIIRFDSKIFFNRFGLANIRLHVYYKDGQEDIYFTEYLSIKVSKEMTNNEIEAMIEYIYDQQEYFFTPDTFSSKVAGDLKKGRSINLETRILLADEILKKYKRNFGYFKANSRFKTEIVDVVDNSEKLQHISYKTLQFISRNPGMLNENSRGAGVKLGKKYYMPNKTLIEKKVYSNNIFENQVIVAFIKKMISDLAKMEQDIDKMMRLKKPSMEDDVNFVYFVLKRTQATLALSKDKVSRLLKEFNKVLLLYKSIFDVDDIRIEFMPKSTAIFLAVPQYHSMFRNFSKWFEYGIYNFDSEKFLMSFMSISDVYEVYLLAKVLNTLSEKGFVLDRRRRFKYEESKTSCDNTYVYTREGQEITLYYKPVIYDGSVEFKNGLGVYRNNLYSINNDNLNHNHMQFYTPDYVLKFKDEDMTRYAILDAKYSTVKNIELNQLQDLVFKYIFSLSTVGKEELLGLYIGCGKASEVDSIKNVYNSIKDGADIKPRYKLIPISAIDSKEKHFEYIGAIIDELIFG